MLANLYLHWFDVKFHRSQGPYVWANARLVRYADDFVIMAKYVGGRIRGFVEETAEKWMGLKINRDKTREVTLGEEGECLNFLGYSFRYDRSLRAQHGRYLNLFPSAKALAKERDAIREMTGRKWNWLPIPHLMEKINQQVRGWKVYFSLGYPRHAHQTVDHFVRSRLISHMMRRSQRPLRPPEGVGWFDYLDQLGLDLDLKSARD